MPKIITYPLSFLLTLLVSSASVAMPANINGAPAPIPPRQSTRTEQPLREEAEITRIFLHESIDGAQGMGQRGFGLAQQQSDPKALAVAFAQQVGQRSNDAGAQVSWQPTRVQTDELGYTHVILAQTYDHLPVFASEMVVHAKNGEGVRAANGEFPAAISIATKPTLSPAAARKVALTHFAGATASTDSAQIVSGKIDQPTVLTEELLIFNPALIDAGANINHLAYRLEIGSEEPLKQWVYFVEAHTGKVLFRYNNVREERDRHIYNMNFGWAPPGVQCYTETGPVSGGSPPSECTNAFNFTGSAYDYFRTRHNRDSFDNNDGAMIAYVNYGTAPNAFWANDRAIFGPGFATKDIVAHEWTHAVTQHSADLIYANQSGALNESISDIFGAMVDRDDWLMGEGSTVGAFRSLADPTRFGHPGKVSDEQFYCGNDSADNGGVHTNSGVPNHAAYLMAEGGDYNGSEITGIGREATERIFYRTLVSYLTRGSDFVDAANALTSACADLFGLDAPTCNSVRAAVTATEMDQPVCGGLNSIPADAFEPDNVVADATAISIDGTIHSHNFHDADDHDWVKFEAIADTEYVIETLNLGARSDTVLALYEADSASLIAQNDDSDDEGASRIVWKAPTSGEYTVRVRHFSPTSYGVGVEYDLRIVSSGLSGNADAYEPDDDPSSASEIIPDAPGQREHNFHIAGDTDWVRFKADANASYWIETLNLDVGNDTMIKLYDTDGETLLAQNDDGGDELASRIEWSAPAGGLYFLRIQRYWGVANTTNSNYDLRISTAPPLPKPDEPNDRPLQATALQVDAPAHAGNFHVAGDEDWYRFTAISDASYALETTELGSSGDTSITLYAADGGTQLAHDDDSGNGLASLIGWTAASSGDYLIKVRHYAPGAYGSNTQYKLAVQTVAQGGNADDFEADDTPATASLATANEPAQTRTFHDAGDADWIRFDAVIGVDYTLQTHDLGPNNDTVIELYAPDATTLLAANDDNGSALGSRIDWFAPSSDAYFVRIRPYSGALFGEDATYQFTITGRGDDHPDTYEDDDNVADASILNGAQLDHNFHDLDDQDWARFTAIAGVDYVIETRNLGRRTDTVLALFDIDGATMLAANDDDSNTLGSRIEWSAPANGDYYVSVHHFSGAIFGANTTYDLHFAEGQIGLDPYEPDDAPTQATIITTDGVSQTHRSDVPGDQDWVRFTADADTTYAIETTNLGALADTYIYLYAPDGITILAQNDDNGEGFASLITWTAASADDYYVMVRNFSDTSGPNTVYDLRIQEEAPQADDYEPDDSPAEAVRISVDGTAQRHNFHMPGDHDWIKFEARANVGYTIETFNLAQLGDTHLALYDQDARTLLAENDDHDNTVASRIEWTAPESGVYYAMVRHFTPDVVGKQTAYDVRVMADAEIDGDNFEPDNLYSQASEIVVDGPVQIHDFHVSGDQDWIAFQAEAGRHYQIETFDLGPASDTTLALYDIDHAILLASNDDYGASFASRIEWTAPVAGVYYLAVQHISSASFGPETRYSLAVTTDSMAAIGALDLQVAASPVRYAVAPGNAVETVIRVDSDTTLIKVQSPAKPAYLSLIDVVADSGQNDGYEHSVPDGPRAMYLHWRVDALPPNGKLIVPVYVTAISNSGEMLTQVQNLIFTVHSGDPKIFDVHPQSFMNDEETTLTVLGSNFQPTPEVYLIKDGESIQLSEVEFVDPDPGDPFLLAVVAAGAKPGKYKVSIKNPDGGEAEHDGIEILSSTAAYAPELSPASSDGSGAAGTNVTYTLHLVNRGGAPDSFDLTVADNTWTTALSVSVVRDLPPGADAVITAVVSIPTTSKIGAKDTVTVTAISHGDPAQSAATTLITTSTGPESSDTASSVYLPTIHR